MTFKEIFDALLKEEQKQVMELSKHLHKNDSFWSARPYGQSVIDSATRIFEKSKLHKKFGHRDGNLFDEQN